MRRFSFQVIAAAVTSIVLATYFARDSIFGLGARPTIFGVIGISLVMSIAVAALFHELLALTVRQPFLKQYSLLSSIIPSIAFATSYGPRTLLSFYSYDDWSFVGLRFASNLNFPILGPINDHFVPLYKVFLIVNSYLSDPTYVGNALSFLVVQVAFLACLNLIFTLHKIQIFWRVILVSGFASWPSFGPARFWFGGGFWLSTATLLLILSLLSLILLKMKSPPSIRPINYLACFLFSAGAAMFSSAVLFPIFFLTAYNLPFEGMPSWRSIRVHVAINFKLYGLIIVPSLFAVGGRLYWVKSHVSLRGFTNGDLYFNLWAFLLNKGFLVNSNYIYRFPGLGFVIFCLLAVACYLLLTVKINAIEEGDSGGMAPLRLISLGLCMTVLYAAQVGMARGWDFTLFLGPYYSVFPLTGLIFILAGTASFLRSHLTTRKNCHVLRLNLTKLTALLIVISAFSLTVKEFQITNRQIRGIGEKKQIAFGIGSRVCDALISFDGNSLGEKERFLSTLFGDFTTWKTLLEAPDEYVSGSIGNGAVKRISMSFASEICPEKIITSDMIARFENIN